MDLKGKDELKAVKDMRTFVENAKSHGFLPTFFQPGLFARKDNGVNQRQARAVSQPKAQAVVHLKEAAPVRQRDNAPALGLPLEQHAASICTQTHRCLG